MTEQTPTIPSIGPYGNDEISISDLLLKLWAKRGLIVMLPLVLAGLAITVLLLNKASHRPIIDYYVELNGITSYATAYATALDEDIKPVDEDIRTRYPNGIVFAPQDLKNPLVLTTLATQYETSKSELASHVSVDFGSPLSHGILIEYEAALSANSGASNEALATINDRYSARLASAAKRGLRISIDYIALGVSEDVGKQLATDLVATWNRVFTTQLKTRLNPETLSQRATLSELDVKSTVGFMAAENQLDQIELGAAALADDGRLAALTSEDGTTASDLIGYLEDFRTIYFEPLGVNALAQNSSLSQLYKRDLQLKIDELSEDASELDRRLNDIQKFQRGVATDAAPSREKSVSATQYDGSALAEVVSLAERAALSDYLEKTLDARRELIAKRSGLLTKLRRIEGAGDTESSSVSRDFLELASAKYSNLVATYGALIKAARKILVAETPSYYAPVVHPTVSTPPTFAKRDIFFIALALALGAMLAVIVALLWRQNP